MKSRITLHKWKREKILRDIVPAVLKYIIKNPTHF
jgi:hypothetical protein